ncbi:hypothetical protein HY469_05810 [Candidatus Roizmanbacteria bacterium]|nr:hypothetical protein [Candidatus Roizmanbacteria bacterium]
MDEQESSGEVSHTSKPIKIGKMTLQQAIDLGEYRPEYLANFAEWHTLSVYVQFQLIRKALEIRHRQLITQYAELNNVLDLRTKPHVQHAIKNVEKQLRMFEQDREELFVRYSNLMAEE